MSMRKRERREEGARPRHAPPPPAPTRLHGSSVGKKERECKGVMAEEEGERVTGGPPLTQKLNRLPRVGLGPTICPSARRDQAPGSGPHQHWGGVWWDSVGCATTVKNISHGESLDRISSFPTCCFFLPSVLHCGGCTTDGGRLAEPHRTPPGMGGGHCPGLRPGKPAGTLLDSNQYTGASLASVLGEGLWRPSPLPPLLR